MFILSFVFSSIGLAQECDTKSLVSSLQESVGDSAAEAFVALHKCDAKQAKKFVVATVPKLYASEIGYQAIEIAIDAGADPQVSTWLQEQLPDERKQALRYLGKSCQSNKQVEEFFLEQSIALGDTFWQQGWYLPLANCSTPEVTKMLADALSRENQSKSVYFNVLSTYARAGKGEAVPLLDKELSKASDEETQTRLIDAFADAAQVGSVNGVDRTVTSVAAEAIIKHGQNFSVGAIEKSRIILNSMDEEAFADEMAAFRYKEFVQPNGSLIWGVIVAENAKCKNGKEKQVLHFAKVLDPRKNTWSDQLADKVDASVDGLWRMDLAKRCKGEGENVLFVSDRPFASEKDLLQWRDAKLEEVKNQSLKDKKIKRLNQVDVQI